MSNNINNKRVSTAEKIQLFKEFKATGQKLKGDTLFKGYPIGRWAIQIRYVAKSNMEQKGKAKSYSISEEQIKELCELGIMERQIDSTITEKIDSIIEWNMKHPKAKVIPVASESDLRKYASTEKEYIELVKRYEVIRGYYKYIKSRNAEGKLTAQQIEKCQDISSSFKSIDEIEEISKKYGHSKKIIKQILDRYDTIENFKMLYITQLLNVPCHGQIDKTLLQRYHNPQKVLAAVLGRLRRSIDIDLDEHNMQFDALIQDLFPQNDRIVVYSSKKINEALQTLKPKARDVIIKRYGLHNGNAETLRKISDKYVFTKNGLKPIAEELDVISKNGLKTISQKKNDEEIEHAVSGESIRQMHKRAIIQLKACSNSFILDYDSCIKILSADERDMITQLFTGDILLQNKNRSLTQKDAEIFGISDGLEILRTLQKREAEFIWLKQEDEKRKILEKKKNNNNKNITKIPITHELGIGVRSYNALMRNGITTLGDIIKYTETDFLKFRNITERLVEELRPILTKFHISFKEEKENEEKTLEKRKTEKHEKMDELKAEKKKEKEEMARKKRIEKKVERITRIRDELSGNDKKSR